jgi:hypothetical protein
MLAGHAFSFESAGPDPVRLPPAFDSFRTHPGAAPATAHYRIHPADAAHWTDAAEVDPIWRTDTWRMGRTPSGDHVLAIHVLPDERPLTVARFAPDFSRGDLLCRAGRHGAPTPYAFNYPCDQVAVLNALNPHGIGVVHAGGVAFDGEGLLFCGRSGAGKTTLSRLCRGAGATLLNDDRQFVWADASGARLAPTPWHGLEPEINHRTVPLRAIFHLVQAPVNRARRCRRSTPPRACSATPSRRSTAPTRWNARSRGWRTSRRASRRTNWNSRPPRTPSTPAAR